MQYLISSSRIRSFESFKSSHISISCFPISSNTSWILTSSKEKLSNSFSSKCIVRNMVDLNYAQGFISWKPVRNSKCPRPVEGGFEQLKFRKALNTCELIVENPGKNDLHQQTNRLSTAHRTLQTSRSIQLSRKARAR